MGRVLVKGVAEMSRSMHPSSAGRGSLLVGEQL
jgi:hypothetical protein